MSNGFKYFDVHQTLLFTPVPLWDPPTDIRPKLLEAERRGNMERFVDLAREYAEGCLVELEIREKERGDAVAEQLVCRWNEFTKTTGCERIAASLTVAWVMAMKGNQ